MADHDPQQPSFWASLVKLGRSVVDLGRAFDGKDPLPAPVEDSNRNDASDNPAAREPEAPLALPAPDAHFEDAQLLTQHTPGWHVPHPTRLPVPTYAPAMTAFGIVFIALGAVTVWPLSVVGVVIFVLAIAKWIGELLHD